MHVSRIIIAALFFLVAPVQAATLNCTLPAANVARGLELCEELRVQLRVRSAEWTNDVCATQFFRLGLVEGERRSSTRTANASVAAAVNDALTSFQSTWVRPTRATCGDGTLDTEVPFSEQCDDGNNTDGDGCDSSCVSE